MFKYNEKIKQTYKTGVKKMSTWYYVEDGDRKGPVDLGELARLVDNHILDEDSYIWTKGFENWERFKSVEQVSYLLSKGGDESAPVNEAKNDFEDIPMMDDSDNTINWQKLSRKERIFMIKIGADRGCSEVEYGPYSLEQLKLAFDQNRVSGKTFFYTAKMASWSFLADMPIFEEVFHQSAPQIDDVDRRVSVRKPFVARMLFHDNEKVYEGICRDISEGGMQVLTSNCPVKLGEEVAMNVHPDNGEYKFVARGKIVRILDGNQGFSLRFNSLEKEAKDSISTYISES